MAKENMCEKALDLMIEEALEIVGNSECEAIGTAEEHEFSKEHELKMKKLFNKLQREDRSRKIIKFSKRAACICLVGFVLFTASVCSVSAWRTWFLDFFFDEDAPNSKFNYNETDRAYYKDDNISLSYIPQGFESTRNTVSEHIIMLLFEKDDLYFTVSVKPLNGQGSVDTEDATVSRIDINDSEAILMEKKDANQIIWRDDESIFTVVGNISSDEIVKIAKNLKKI